MKNNEKIKKAIPNQVKPIENQREKKMAEDLMLQQCQRNLKKWIK